MYQASYSYCRILRVFFKSFVQPRSMQLNKDFANALMMFVMGITQAMKHEIEIVLPIAANQLPPKSQYWPARMGKPSGRLITLLRLAFIIKMTSAVLMNCTIHNFEIQLSYLSSIVWLPSILVKKRMTNFSTQLMKEMPTEIPVRVEIAFV